jgi:hypothetical protein
MINYCILNFSFLCSKTVRMHKLCQFISGNKLFYELNYWNLKCLLVVFELAILT